MWCHPMLSTGLKVCMYKSEYILGKAMHCYSTSSAATLSLYTVVGLQIGKPQCKTLVYML